jgi:GntR family transcriptional regulator / MocR family aminotransferase
MSTSMLLPLDGDGPLHRQVYRALRGAILGGTLRPGERMPSTRMIAAESRVSRITAVIAYDQLIAEGYAEPRRGSGTYVAAALGRDGNSRVRRLRGVPAPPRLSAYGRRISAPARGNPPSWAPRPVALPYDFRYGRPAIGDFPHATWRRLVARRARRISLGALDYGPPEGLPELRATLADYLRRARAVVCDESQIVVVNGSQQALDLVARVLLEAGDLVLLEEPHYAGARRVFEGIGARLRALPVGGEGLDIERLSGPGRQFRAAYVTPSHQFPLGVVMSVSRRLALLDWAARTGAYVVEDDYDSEYRYVGRPIESLQGLDRTGRVLYVGTFSKVLFPALRLGYLVLPRPLVDVFRTAKALADTGSSTLEQGALADFMREGHYERHLRRSRARVAARRAALLESVAAHLGERVEVHGVDAGLHVVLRLRDVRRERLAGLIERAAAVGVGVYPATPYYLRPPPQAGLLLGYASLDEGEIRRGIERLGRCLKQAPPSALERLAERVHLSPEG